MSSLLSDSMTVTIPDEFPPRPTSMMETHLMRMNSKIERKEIYTVILLCLTFFLYGSSLGLYGPLYPKLANTHRVGMPIYGSVMSLHYLVALLFYPLACLTVGSINCRLAISIGIFMTGACKVYFGTLPLVVDIRSFIALSYSIQIVEGIGLSVLLAATSTIIFSLKAEKTRRNRGFIRPLFVLGISLSPIWGEAAFKAYNYTIPFYGIGILLSLCSLLLIIMLPEPEQRLPVKALYILSWVTKPRMFIYFVVVFSTFNYIGFLTVTLEPYLRGFHLSNIFIGVLFSVPGLSCLIFAPGWTWLSEKGFNSVLLICISCLSILASLIMIGPPPFIPLKITLANTSYALLLCGFGIGGKLACVVYTTHRDLRFTQIVKKSHVPLLISTMFVSAALLGCFSGSFLAGFTLYYLDMAKAEYFLLGLEVVTVAICFVFAFKRHYRSQRILTESDERRPILEP